MKVSPALFVLLAAGAVFLLTPYIPYSILKVVTGKYGAITLLALVLYALAVDRILGLATFLAVAALFLEQRRRTVENININRASDPVEQPKFSVEQLEKPAPNIVAGEVHPPSKEAEVEDYSFEPTEESGKNKFDDVGESYNEKQPLDTVPPQPNVVSELFQMKGLAHLN